MEQTISTLHQVYELLLIEMESAYSYSAALPQNVRYTKFMRAVDRNRICIAISTQRHFRETHATPILRVAVDRNGINS